VSYGWQPSAERSEQSKADSGGPRPLQSVQAKADVAQLAERVLGKDEVTGSIPVIGSRLKKQESGASAGRFHFVRQGFHRYG
jgi:hypothetical protein